MPRSTAQSVGGRNVAAFLDMLAWSEIGEKLLHASDDGYNVIGGGELFHDYSAHPGRLVELPKLGIKSTAAGRYQFLKRTWGPIAEQLKLPDFGPMSQDRGAVLMLRWAGAMDSIIRGDVEDAMWRCRKFWASLPGAGYGQHEQKAGKLVAIYKRAGGRVAA